ncbi:methyltransferase domain-containing protein [Aquitalea sp. LB_tupeE]|uniref:methyltransferase domain-containing protein n=1 Tax=Aquitalea sp. LB_tupeE TaxID=2748078 RepID=UPI0015BEAFA7|nr:methyltransferase domain-containing protein [Aquitalea sp. LB_tupeE]NWK79188.1 methyltransferase domain-containing protein [Aquitalea sp. LB_tupeE]
MAQDSSLPAFWDQRYEQGVTPWEGAAGDTQMQQFFARLAPDSKVLLPGCGSAVDVPWLLSAGMRVDAIDFSHEAVKRARQALQGSSARLWQADFFALQADAHYDAIFERAFLCALPPRLWESYTHKVSQLLRPGGFLAGVFFLADKPKGPPYGTSLAELHQRLDPAFSLLSCQPVAAAIPVFAGQEYWMVWQRLAD